MNIKFLLLNKGDNYHRGEIATTLAVIGVGLMLVGLFVGTKLVNTQTQTKSSAAATADISLCPNNELPKIFQGPQTCAFSYQTVTNTVFDGLYRSCVPGDWGRDKPSSCLQSTGLPSTAPLYFFNCQNITVPNYSSYWMACSTATAPPTATPTVTPTITPTPSEVVNPFPTSDPSVTLGPQCTTLLTNIRSAWHASCGTAIYDKIADTNNDKTIDIFDLGMFRQHQTDETWCTVQLEKTFDPCTTTMPQSCVDVYTRLNNSWGAQCGEAKYDKVADMNNDKIINATDWERLFFDNATNVQFCDSQLNKTYDPCNPPPTLTPTPTFTPTCQTLLGTMNRSNISSCYYNEAKYNPIADLNKDNIVDQKDYDLLNTNNNHSNDQWCAQKMSENTHTCGTPPASYNLIASTQDNTTYNFITIPPSKTNITDADSLGADIGDVQSILNWDGSGFKVHQIGTPFGNYSVSLGSSYLVTTRVSKTWPVASSGGPTATPTVTPTPTTSFGPYPSIIPGLPGKIVFSSGVLDTDLEVATMNADGTDFKVITHVDGAGEEPSFSPDGGSQIVFSIWGPNQTANINKMNSDGTNIVALTHNEGQNTKPIFTKDGSQIIFESTRDSASIFYPQKLYIMNADGTNVRKLFNTDLSEKDASLTPDGRQLLFDGRDSTGNTDIYMVNMDGTNLTRLTSGPGTDEQPVYLPDGTGIIFAYQDPGSTRSALYQRMPDGTIKLLFDRTYGGVSPALSPDGTKVLFDMQGLNIFDRTTQSIWRLPQPAGDHFSFSGNNTWILTANNPPLACPAACNYANTITTRPGRDHGDANCDGLVNLNDFGIWLEQYQAAIAAEVNGVSPIIPADQRSANFACNQTDATTQIVTTNDFKVWLNSYVP